MMTENEVSNKVIGCAIEVHRCLGPGLLESAYKNCLLHELVLQNLGVTTEEPIPLIFKGIHLECGYRTDIIVEGKVIIEIKAEEALNDLHLAQVLTYLKLKDCRLGLLFNFNVLRLMNDGFRRVANRFVEESSH